LTMTLFFFILLLLLAAGLVVALRMVFSGSQGNATQEALKKAVAEKNALEN